MVRKERIGIPRPSSSFLSGTCVKCGTENIFYSICAEPVKCRQCGEVLAENTGGKIIYTASLAKEVKRLDFA